MAGFAFETEERQEVSPETPADSPKQFLFETDKQPERPAPFLFERVNPESPTSQTLQDAMEKNPDQAGKKNRLGRERGIDPSTISDEELPTFERQSREEDSRRFLFESPTTQRYVANPTRAEVIHDDLENLSSMERLSRAFERGETLRALGLAGFNMIGSDDPAAQQRVKDLRDRLAELGHDTEGGFVGWLTAAAEVVGQQVSSFGDPRAAERVALGGTAGAVAGTAGGPFAPVTVPSGAAAGLGAGFLSHIMLDSFEVEGGLAYIDLLEEGVDQDVASVLAYGVGTINAGLEVVGATVVLKPLAEAGKKVFRDGLRQAVKRPAIRKAATDLAKAYGAGVLAEVSTEVMQEIVNIAAEELGKTFTEGKEFAEFSVEEAADRIEQIAIQTFKAMSVLAAPGPSVNFAVEVKQAREADRNKEAADRMQELYQASKVRERDADLAAEFVGDALLAQDITEVFIPADKLRDWATTARDLAEAEGVLAGLGVIDTIDEAASLGQDVRIEPDKFARYILNSENYAGISSDLRFDKEGVTANEAEEIGFLQEAINRVADEAERPAPVERVIPEPDPVDQSPRENIESFEEIVPIRNFGEAVEAGTITEEGLSTGATSWVITPRGKLVRVTKHKKSHDGLPRISAFNMPGVRSEVAATLPPENVTPAQVNTMKLLKRPGITFRNVEQNGQHFEVDEYQLPEEAVEVTEHELGLRGLFNTAEEAGMTEKQYTDYLTKLRRAQDDSMAAIKDRALRQQQRQVTKEWKAAKQDIQQKVEEHLLQSVPAYATVANIGAIRLDKAQTQAMLEEIGMNLDLLPRQTGNRRIYTTVKKEPGIDPDTMAELAGYDDGQSMLADIVNTRPFDEEVAIQVNRQMMKEFGDLRQRKDAILEAREALHHNNQVSVIESELAALRRAEKSSPANTKLLKLAARQRVRDITIRDLDPNKFLNAHKRAAKRAGVELRKGNMADAAQAKFQQLVNFYMAQEAYRLQRKVDRQKKYLSKFQKKKEFPNIEAQSLAAIRELLAQVVFTPTPKSPGVKNLTARANAEIDPAIVPEQYQNPDERTNFRDMTLAEFQEMHDTVKELEKKGRDWTKLRNEQEKRKTDIISSFIIDEIVNNLAPKKNDKETRGARQQSSRWSQYSREIRTLLYNTDTVLREIDKFEDLGVAYEHLKGPYDKAISSGYQPGQKGYFPRLAEEAVRIKDLYSEYTKKERLDFNKKFTIPGVRGRITRAEVMSVLLNSGNEGNIQAMLESETFTEAEIEAIQQFADAKDWRFAQKVWDYFEEFWSEIVTTEERRRNYTPEKVQAQPIETPHGTFRGGYYPIRYDKGEDSLLSPEKTSELLDTIRYGKRARSQTARGHTEQRKDNPHKKPVKLDLFTINSHIDTILYDLEVGDAISDIFKILHQRDVKAAFREAGHQHYWDHLDLWLRDIVTGEVGVGTKLESGLRWLRSGFTISKLAWNISTMLLQPLGIIQSSVQIGKKHTYRGLRTLMSSPWTGNNSIQSFINAQSEFMRARSETFNKDILDAQKQISFRFLDRITPGNTADVIRDSFFWGIKKTQRFADFVTWLGARSKGMEQFDGDVQKANEFADRMVARSQASGIFGERTPLERGSASRNIRQTEFIRAWTPLISYFMAKTNVAIERTKKTDFKNPAQVLGWASDMLLLYTVEALLAGLIRGMWPEPEDDETFIEFAAEETVNNVFAGVPLLREATSEAVGFRSGGTIISTARAFGDAWKQVRQAELDEQLFRSMNNLGGILFHYPSAQINKTFSAAAKRKEGEDIGAVRFIFGPKFERQR